MQTERTLIEELKHQFSNGGMTMKLIFVNLIVFVFIALIKSFGRLMLGDIQVEILNALFTLDTSFSGFIVKPWGLFTSIFAHFDFFHLFFNMLMLYFAGRAFEQVFNRSRLLYTYILGGVIGGIFEMIAHEIFPIFEGIQTVVVGASGSTMAIFIALAFHKPNLKVEILPGFSFRLMILAAFFLIKDLLAIATPDHTAHFAHIGGAVLGIISVQNIHSESNFITLIQRYMKSIVAFFRKLFGKRQPTFTIKQGGSGRGGVMTDEEYNYEVKQRQQKVDQILDKIAKSGYESLSKAEKDFLFNHSKNGK